jgi:hypothetical protein
MPAVRKPAARPVDRSEHEMRDQEVLRATKELAAYFKGARTGREARAALKIIKAFIRDRERITPAERRPLPGHRVAGAPRAGRARDARVDASKKRRSRSTTRQRRHVTPAAEELHAATTTDSTNGESVPSKDE